jgi:hypothetical protein
LKLKSVFQLVYISRAHDGICYSDIQEILESSRQYNQKHNLTGLLVYKDDHFLQILEGEQEFVKEAFSEFTKDRRSMLLGVLAESESEHRIFSRWPLAFHDADIDRNMMPLMEDLFKVAHAKGKKEKKSIIEILESFRRGCSHFQDA